MQREEFDIDKAIDEILCMGKKAEVKPKQPRGRQRKETSPIWAIEFGNPEKNRTFALISMCIKDDMNQSVSELAKKLSALKGRPVSECLTVADKLLTRGELGFYDDERYFRKWAPGEGDGVENVTNYEKMIKEMTAESLAADMMCPYDGTDALPCLDNPALRGHCTECCLEYLLKEVDEDAEM